MDMVWHDDIFAKTDVGIYVMIGTPWAVEKRRDARAVRKQRDAVGGVPYGKTIGKYAIMPDHAGRTIRTRKPHQYKGRALRARLPAHPPARPKRRGTTIRRNKWIWFGMMTYSPRRTLGFT
ncbi:MAG: hypothetical protein LBS45_09710 [Synergistaceae bacterium]|jgi:hypothetical protein|nr:hypothetical protein [Synergistaceae bacterium]